jgi:hypothetical protein
MDGKYRRALAVGLVFGVVMTCCNMFAYLWYQKQMDDYWASEKSRYVDNLCVGVDTYFYLIVLTAMVYAAGGIASAIFAGKYLEDRVDAGRTASLAGIAAAAISWGRHDGSLEAAFLRVFEEIEKEVAVARAVLPSVRMTRAADEIVKRCEGAMRCVFIDGFETFNDPELTLIDALSRHADLVVTLPAWDGAVPARAALHAMDAGEIELEPSLHRFPVPETRGADSGAWPASWQRRTE